MKNLISGCLVLACLYSTQAYADEALVMVKKGDAQTAELKAFQNLDQKLESLDNYSVTYVEANSATTVFKEAKVAQRSTVNDVHIKLFHSKKRKLS